MTDAATRVGRVHARAAGLALATLIVGGWVAVHLRAVVVGQVPDGALAVALLLAQCWLNVGLFIVAHDAMHGSLAPGWRALNTAVGTLALALYAGFSYARLAPEHHRHHAHPGTADDPDFDVHHSAAPVPWFANFVRHYFGWREFALLTLFQAVYVFGLGVDWPRMLIFWAVPAVASSMQLFWFGTYLPHRTGAGAFADRHRARSNPYSWLGSLLSCYHFGYHHEHHLFPGVPWWRLPRVYAARRGGG